MATKADALRALRDLGGMSAGCTFDGGGDEGGINDCWWKDANDEKHDIDPYAYEESDDEGPEEAIASFFHGIVDSKYGSFAGEFYVSGRIDLDPVTGEAKYKESYEDRVWRESSEIY